MNLLTLGKAVPRELVLCTFTEKAALELRDRMAAAALSERHPQRAVGNRKTYEIHGGT
jgi:ATP-dependent exoDNAse (exonuclease V) beta subunit